MNPLVKAFLGSTIRHLLTSFLTLVIVRQYIGADIAAKLMHGDTVTLWNGYNLSLNTMVDYLVTALPAIALPIMLSFWLKVRTRFKFLAALQLPSSTPEKKVDAIVKETPATEIVKSVATGSLT